MTVRLSTRFDLSGRTAVVVVGEGDLGGYAAHALGRAGARVVLVQEDEDAGARAVARMQADDVVAQFLPSRVTEAGEVDRVVTAILEQHGRVDVLVTAIDETAPSPAAEMGPGDWDRVLRSNLDSVWLWSQAFGRVFVDQGAGAIVTIGSVSGTLTTRPQWDPARAASQAAVQHLTRCLAAEWAPHGVRVNTLAVGYLATEGTAAENPLTRRHVLEDTPMERLGTVEEITPAVVFLAGDASSFITGQVLLADGGYSTF